MSDKEKAIWPENKSFAVCLTHDVDRVKKTYQYVTHFFKTGRIYHLGSLFNQKWSYWNFEDIMKIEEKYGVKSTFFFLQETKKVNPLNLELLKATSGKYKFSEERIISIIKLLLKNGWEIALHGSYDSYKDKNLLATEKKLLEDVTGEKIAGVRQHWLNIEIPKTWQIQKEVGFEYDSSWGSNEDVEFSKSEKFPFAPLNDEFWVIPITIMDTALFSKYRKIKEAWFKCKDVLLQASQTNCLVTVLWHQHVFNEKDFPGWKRIYEDIIAFSLENNAWVTCARNIVKWWKTKKPGVNYG